MSGIQKRRIKDDRHDLITIIETILLSVALRYVDDEAVV